MADISLHTYLQQIESLLEESRLAEAVAHCRHILEQYPRHIPTYRLLGKALLERGEFNAAADIFRRVLSADPEDFVAHVGLAIVNQEDGLLPQALWHMERAYDMDPYNNVIQQELREMYGRRSGRVPPRLVLTDEALARLYAKGELYQQAAAELQQCLERDPERVDLQALLARTLWRDERRSEAVEASLKLLDRLPNCIVANAILAEVWLSTGRINEAQAYLRRVQELLLPTRDSLDPDSPAGRAFNTEGAFPLPAEVRVSRLDEDKLVAAEMGGEAGWVSEVTWRDEADSVEAGEGLAWLSGLEVEETGAERAPADAEAALQAMPDWLQESLEQGELPDWLQEAELELSPLDEPSEEALALPLDDPFNPFLGDEEPAGEEALPFDAAAGEESEERLLGEETVVSEADDWLADLDSDAFSEEIDHVPSWLREMDEVDMAGSDMMGEEPAGEETVVSGADDWLADLDSDALSEEIDHVPSWLREMDEVDTAGSDMMGEEPAEDEAAEAATAAKAEPTGWNEAGWGPNTWETGEAEEDVLAGLPTIDTGELNAWLAEYEADSVAEPAGEASTAAEPESVFDWEEPSMSEPEDQDKWRDEPEDSEVPEDLDAALAWLEGLAANQGAPLEELPSLYDEESAGNAGDVYPDWLAADLPEPAGVEEDLLSELSAAKPVMPEEPPIPADIPEWLRESASALGLDDLDAPAGPESWEAEEPASDLSWLDQIAAGEGAAIEEGPTLSWDDEPGRRSDPATAPAPADALGWLDELSEEPELMAPEMGESGSEDWLPAGGAVDEMGLEMPAQEEAVAAEEFSWEDMLWGEEEVEPAGREAQVQPPAVRDEDLALSEDIAFGEEDMADESVQPVPDVTLQEGMTFDEGAAVDDMQVYDVPEDLEDAMAWLEQLAARQGAPLDELPTLDDEEFAALATEPTIVEEPPTPAGALWEMEEGIAPPQVMVPAEATAEESAGDIPDDPDEALAWLEQMARADLEAGEPAGLSTAPVVEEPPTPAMPQAVPAEAEVEVEPAGMPLDLDVSDDELSSNLLDAIPDDPDAAMAWLEQLAARQGAPLDELPSVSEVSDDVAMPDWMADMVEYEREMEEAEARARAEAEAAAEVPDLMDGFDAAELDEIEEAAAEAAAEMAAQEAALEEMTAAGRTAAAEQAAQEAEAATQSPGEWTLEMRSHIEESLPDWLAINLDDEPDELGLAWEQLGSDVTGWLVAEEELREQEPPAPPPPPRPEPARLEATQEPRVSRESWAQTERDVTPPAPRPAPMHVDDPRLQRAQNLLAQGDYRTALQEYRALADQGEYLDVLIEQLEQIQVDRQTRPLARQLLGDIYLRSGQHQKALDIYRDALEMF